MKVTLALVLLVSTAIASAITPKVGDYAVWNGVMEMSEGTFDIKLKNEIISINPDEKIAQVKTTASILDQEQEEIQNIALPSLGYLESEAQLEQLCSSSNGTMAPATVAAGTFASCIFTNEDGDMVQLGVVPFGFLRLERFESSVSAQLKIELTEYNYGSKQ